MLLKTFC